MFISFEIGVYSDYWVVLFCSLRISDYSHIFFFVVNKNFYYRTLPFNTKNWFYFTSYEFKSLNCVFITFVFNSRKGNHFSGQKIFEPESYFIQTFTYKFSATKEMVKLR